jgi:2,4-didehydro-3-deoxy-L-rhamnonate hydrolase
MKLATLSTPAGDRIVGVGGDAAHPRYVDLCAVDRSVPTTMKSLLAAKDGLQNAAFAILKGTREKTFIEGRLRAPIPDPGKVICIGLNYRDHALEAGRAEIPTVPVIFGRWTASLVCDGDECPLIEERYDWEGELGVVVGEKMFRVDAADGLKGVFGYCAFNDLSARTFQRATPQWTFGKNGEKSGPISPIATADAVGDPARGLRLTTRVNDQIMQDDTTQNLIFTVGVLVEYISQLMTLNPGDLIATGTPAGIGAARRPPVFLRAGDTVEVEIEKVGKVANKIVALATLAK